MSACPWGVPVGQLRVLSVCRTVVSQQAGGDILLTLLCNVVMWVMWVMIPNGTEFHSVMLQSSAVRSI